MFQIPIPDPSGVANNLDAMYFRRKEWARQQKNDEVRRDAELFAEIQLLADAMNAYHDGYRQLDGELQDFRTNWTQQQREHAENHYRAWIDPRAIFVKIAAQRTLLKERRRKDESLKQIIKKRLDTILSAADHYDHTTLNKLLGRKESDTDRAQLIHALAAGRTTMDAEIVKDWVDYTRRSLDEGKQYLDSVTAETAELKADLPILDESATSATRKTPWYKRITSPLRRRTPKGN